MLTFFDYGPSANCLKVRILLRQLGIECERVEVDIFAGESRTDHYLALNPAGRTPALVLPDGTPLAESGAVLLYLAEGSALLPADRGERGRVHQWMFFEQNLLEPTVGTARFWRLTGRAEQRPEVFEQRVEAGRAALEVLNRGLTGREFLVSDRYSVADIALYAYTHVADGAGIDLADYPAIGPWLARVASTDGFVNDLEPYPPNARVTG